MFAASFFPFPLIFRKLVTRSSLTEPSFSFFLFSPPSFAGGWQRARLLEQPTPSPPPPLFLSLSLTHNRLEKRKRYIVTVLACFFYLSLFPLFPSRKYWSGRNQIHDGRCLKHFPSSPSLFPPQKGKEEDNFAVLISNSASPFFLLGVRCRKIYGREIRFGAFTPFFPVGEFQCVWKYEPAFSCAFPPLFPSFLARLGVRGTGVTERSTGFLFRLPFSPPLLFFFFLPLKT